MKTRDKPLVWLHGQVKSPPFAPEARLEAGYLLRLLQQGESLGLPRSRPMPSIGPGCLEFPRFCGHPELHLRLGFGEVSKCHLPSENATLAFYAQSFFVTLA